MRKRRPSFKSEKFAQIVEQAGTEIAAGLKRATIISNHHATSGAVRETGLRDFLRRLLPARYYVGTGFVFDAKDCQSSQLDVIVAREPPFVGVFEKDGLCYLPCEVVLAVIEVKKTLNADEVRDSLKKAASVRSLKPFGNQAFTSAKRGGAELPPKQHRCFYGVVASDSDLVTEGWAQREWDRLKRLAAENAFSPDIIDRIMLLDRGLLNTVNEVAQAHLDAIDEVALSWFIHLSNLLDREARRRPAFDPDIYALSGQWTKLK